MKREPFSRIAILNRGEAAIRFMRAAQTYSGIHSQPLETVAYYTTPDRSALFVRMATYAYDLGEALVPGPDGKMRSAYLDIQRVINITKGVGATAIWPGWGFLAESAEFAKACEENDITFIGPSSSAILLLGDKIRAKRLAEQCNVPVTGWSDSDVKDVDEARKMAAKIGYPLLVKASAGGGGRGIRIVRADDELEVAFDSARSEALSAFGCADVLMEQLVEKARHVEVQILADTHGTVWALGTRDCSVQRRHQKLIEEAPAPDLPSEIEKVMCDAAIKVAKESKYVGAGTAEFLYEPDTQKFYFLEMNTRLQVEHTITEEIYGVDLAVQQIRVALGERLPSAEPPERRGCAIELRLNAENPDEEFAPSAGKISRFEAPQGPGIRFDSGYSSDDEIPTEFDSNIAKIISRGANRDEAFSRLSAVLRDTIVAIAGGPTNRSLLMELVTNDQIRKGPVTTHWLDHYLETRPSPAERPGLGIALAAAALGDHLRHRRGCVLNFLNSAQRGLPQRSMLGGPTKWRYVVGKQSFDLAVASLASGLFRITCGDGGMDLRALNTGRRTMILEESNGARHTVLRIATATAVHVDVDGVARTLTRASDGSIVAPIPAAVTRVHVKVGDSIQLGDKLITLEVMKMESAVASPQSGVVTEVFVDSASRVAAGDPLITIEEEVAEDGASTAVAESPFSQEPRPLKGLSLLRAALLGYDVNKREFDNAVSQLETGELSFTRDELTGLLDVILLQESLFARGIFDDARNDSGESSADQLLRFIRHPLGDEEALSETFKGRLDKFLRLHNLVGRRRRFELEASLLRLFYSNLQSQRLHRFLFALVDAIVATEGCEESEAERDQSREILEGFAHYAVGENRRLAQSIWQVIFRLYDQPQMVLAAQAEEEEVSKLVTALICGEENITRASVLEFSLASLLRTAARDEHTGHSFEILSLMMEHLYEGDDLILKESRETGRITVASSQDENRWVAGALILCDSDVSKVVAACDGQKEADLFWGSEPEESQVAASIGDLHDFDRVSFVWAAPQTGIRVRTFARINQQLQEQTFIRDIHPARPMVGDLERWENFHLERLDAPSDICLALATSKDGSGDQRLLVLGEVDRFDPVRGDSEPGGISIPAFESMFHHAIYSISQALTSLGLGQTAKGRGNRKRLVWNRISLFYRPVVRLTRHDIEHLAARLSLWAPGLGLEKVNVQARFANPAKPEAVPKTMCMEWSEPTKSASVLHFARPVHTPHKVVSNYEQRVVNARRAGKFYPYELVRALTTRSDGTGFADGAFEELDLSENGTELISVAERPWGQNQANLVVGKITNEHSRFPQGLSRVIIIGDPTRSMGALAQPECERIIGAIDYAEKYGLAVEWVPVSSGAKIAFDSGTENLDWTAKVLRRIILFTQDGGVINIVVDGICVGAQSYWNAEATMLNHCRGALVMTGQGSMLLTGKKALEYSGSVSASTNLGIGGLEEIMWPNGEAQYSASDIRKAYQLLFQHYALTGFQPGHNYISLVETTDPLDRDLAEIPYEGSEGFNTVGEIFSNEHNPGRKRPFAIREVICGVLDQDVEPIERWQGLEGGESAVVFQGQLAGCPLTCIGIESKSVPRRGHQPIDGPDAWTSGTLFPHSSRKVARAIHTSSGVAPVLVLANLSGFDGSPESMRSRQLEFGAEIGRAVVNFKGPILFCVISRYHGGAYVVFSQELNPGLESCALEGSYASVIGGGPAAAVVFPREVRQRVQADERVKEAQERVASQPHCAEEEAKFEAVMREVEAEMQAQVAGEFDAIHSVERAMEVGSLSRVIPARSIRADLGASLRVAVEKYLQG